MAKRRVGKSIIQTPAGSGNGSLSNRGRNVAVRNVNGGTTGQGTGGSLRASGARIKQTYVAKKAGGTLQPNATNARTQRIPK